MKIYSQESVVIGKIMADRGECIRNAIRVALEGWFIRFTGIGSNPRCYTGGNG